MLTCELIHPGIQSCLAFCGHGSKILIADGNYPLSEKTGDAKKIYLGLTRDVPTVTQVLSAILSAINIEKAEVMDPKDGSEPEIYAEFRSILGDIEFDKMGRYEFYDACMKGQDVMLAISTGEQRTFANILITVGCA